MTNPRALPLCVDHSNEYLSFESLRLFALFIMHWNSTEKGYAKRIARLFEWPIVNLRTGPISIRSKRIRKMTMASTTRLITIMINHSRQAQSPWDLARARSSSLGSSTLFNSSWRKHNEENRLLPETQTNSLRRQQDSLWWNHPETSLCSTTVYSSRKDHRYRYGKGMSALISGVLFNAKDTIMIKLH